MLDHFLGDTEVGNHTVAHRADRLDRTGRAPKHHLCVFTDRKHALFAILVLIRDHRRLVKDDAFAFDIDQRIGGPEVHGHIRRENTG